MKTRVLSMTLLAAASLAISGCMGAPGKPTPDSAALRPDQVLDSKTLFKQNCSACHGENGQNGAAISLSNPVYLATAGADNIRRTIAQGVHGALMPPFAKSQNGLLTDEQINNLTQGMLKDWAHPEALGGQTPPPYASSTAGDAGRGKQAFALFCARCHGAEGAGNPANATPRAGVIGSIVDPAYLALISDQGLRSIIISGRPEHGMPDWRAYLEGPKARAMTDEEITDIVAWLISHRTESPGQPYPTHP